VMDLALYPPGHVGSFMAFTCGSGEETTITGAVLAQKLKYDGMLTKAPVAYEELAGKQRAQAVEGGAPEVLHNQHGEEVGLETKLTLSYGEATEISGEL